MTIAPACKGSLRPPRAQPGGLLRFWGALFPNGTQSKPPVCFRKRAARGRSGLWGLVPEGLALRLIVRRRRTILVLRHERVELFLVLGVAQASQEILELLLLFLEAAQRLRAVLVEGAVAG